MSFSDALKGIGHVIAHLSEEAATSPQVQQAIVTIVTAIITKQQAAAK